MTGHDASDYYRGPAGELRWRSNDQVIPLHVWRESEMADPQPAAQEAVYRRELRAFLADYRRAQARRTPEQIAEQRAEARAAHGPGVTLVDVVTGERYRTGGERGRT
jgi:hypothetical protein